MLRVCMHSTIVVLGSEICANVPQYHIPQKHGLRDGLGLTCTR